MPKRQTAPSTGESWEHETASTHYPEHQSSHFRLCERSQIANGQGAEPVYDLEERTARFAEAVIEFVKRMPQNPTANRVIDQLVGAGTSIGANYCEADEAVSKKEFLNKIGTCKKEAKETRFFLRMAAKSVPELQDEARRLWREAKELHLIFAKIYRSGRSNEK